VVLVSWIKKGCVVMIMRRERGKREEGESAKWHIDLGNGLRLVGL